MTLKRVPGVRREPERHRTIDRATRILEEVVYRPGMGFAELVRALGASKSSVHGFVDGLVAAGWLHEDRRRFYLGPAVYGLTLASGHLRAGLATHADLEALHRETGLAVFLGVEAGDHLIYVAEVGADPVAGYDARSNIRRALIETAGGKALLAARSEPERERYLRRLPAADSERVREFLESLAAIRANRYALNRRHGGARCALATTLDDRDGQAVAAVTIVGPAAAVEPRIRPLARILLRHVDAWRARASAPRASDRAAPSPAR